MDVWIRAGVIILGSIIGSGGLWAYLQSKDLRRDATTRLMMGLAYAQLTSLGTYYTNRGWITRDEYSDYLKYYYEPYKALGGNGVAERVTDGVRELPLRSVEEFKIRNREGEFINNVRVVSGHRQETNAE